MTEQDMNGVDKPYFRKLFRQTVENVDAVEHTMQGYLDRTLDELDPIEKAILRLAVHPFLWGFLVRFTRIRSLIRSLAFYPFPAFPCPAFG